MTPRTWADLFHRNGNGDGRQAGLEAMVANALAISRLALQRSMQPDRRRDYQEEYGHPKEPTVELYRALYRRNPIANRVVKVMALQTWQVSPSVYEVEDEDVLTPFEADWLAFCKGLRGPDSLYQDEPGAAVWEWLRRADVLCGIGRYGALLLGLDDGLPLSQPAQPKPGRRCLYLRAFAEDQAEISLWDEDPASPRYGQPAEYRLSVGREGATPARVHWSRVLHQADNLDSSEVLGAPRQEAVLDLLLDLHDKLYGGCAEMYFRGAMPGWAVTTPTGEAALDPTAVREGFEQMMNGLQRYVGLEGAGVASLAPQVVDPRPQIDALLEAVAIQLDMPVRILKGSERGELSSAQDSAEWDDTVRGRQRGHTTPRQIVPLVDRLIALGVLRPPAEGYSVWWPDLKAQDEVEKAQVAAARTKALADYVTSGARAVVPELEYLVRYQGFTAAEAQAMLDAREEEPPAADAVTTPQE